jgi:hypothetical protein
LPPTLPLAISFYSVIAIPTWTRRFTKSLSNRIGETTSNFVALCFRDAAKSTLAEECLILGSLVQAFHYAVIVCATVERAVQHLDSIKHEIETNEVIEEVFGDQRGETWQQTRITLANGTCIDAIGASQNTRGMKYRNYRPDFVFYRRYRGAQSFRERQRLDAREARRACPLVPRLCPVSRPAAQNPHGGNHAS